VFAFTSPTLERGSAFQVTGRTTFVAVLRGFLEQVRMAASAPLDGRWWRFVNMSVGG